MSSKLFNVSDVKYLDPQTLKEWILQGRTNLGSKFVVVDVRGDDHVGGHIINSVHIKSGKFKDESSTTTMSSLLHSMRQERQETVVFHCMLSQQRGPSSAVKFMHYLNRKLESSNDEEEIKFIEGLQINILRGGFSSWQSLYGEDINLTANYAKDIWKYGY